MIPKVSAVIATVGRKVELRASLQSLKEQEVREVEVVLVDQNQAGFLDEIVAEFASQFAGFNHLATANRGLSRARNIGAAAATGSIICFPDDDAEFQTDTVTTALNMLENEPELDVVSGKTIDRNGNDSVIHFHPEVSDLSLSELDGRFVEATMFIRRDVFLKFKFDETLGAGTFHGAEEGYDLVLRMLDAGVRMRYSPNIRFYHPQKVITHLTREEIRRVFQYRCGFSRMCLKHRLYWKLLKQASLVTGYCGFLLLFDRGKLRYYLAELLGLAAGVIVPPPKQDHA